MEVDYHSKIKHWLLEGYIKICIDVHKRSNTPFYYIDMFSGDGNCECSNPKDSWDGSPIIVAKKAQLAKFPFHCIFNDIDPKQIRILESLLKKYPDCQYESFNKDANTCIQQILSKIPVSEHSLFFLDPFKHTQLLWQTLEKITNHASPDNYNGESFVRRPEMLINLMTYTMQMDYQQHPQYIDAFFGNNKWQRIVQKYHDNNVPVHKGFLEAYALQIQEIYGVMPFIVEIKQTGRSLLNIEGGNVIYYLLFVSSHPLANKIFTNYQKYIQNYKSKTWISNFFHLKGFKILSEFC